MAIKKEEKKRRKEVGFTAVDHFSDYKFICL